METVHIYSTGHLPRWMLAEGAVVEIDATPGEPRFAVTLTPEQEARWGAELFDIDLEPCFVRMQANPPVMGPVVEDVLIDFRPDYARLLSDIAHHRIAYVAVGLQPAADGTGLNDEFGNGLGDNDVDVQCDLLPVVDDKAQVNAAHGGFAADAVNDGGHGGVGIGWLRWQIPAGGDGPLQQFLFGKSGHEIVGHGDVVLVVRARRGSAAARQLSALFAQSSTMDS